MAVLAVYWPVKSYDFVNINDFDYVTKNEHIKNGFSIAAVKWALTSQVAGNWHPLTMLSHMLDCQLYGLDAGWHHLTSVWLHAASSVLLFWVLLRLIAAKDEQGNDDPATFWLCTFVTVIFAFHPLRVESVVWISERKDVLSALFFMLTLWAYVRYVKEAKGLEWYLASLLFFALGLMSKPMLVTLPCVLLLIDYWPLKRFYDLKSFTAKLVEKIPFFLLTIGLSIATFMVQKKVGAMGSLEKLSITARLTNAIFSYGRYLEKTVWPSSLAVLYPMPEHWVKWQVAVSAGVFLALSILAVWTVRRRPYIFVGWFWFVGMLVPVIGLVQVGTQAMADRFTYLPCIGLLIAIAWGLNDGLTKLRHPIILPIITAILAISCLAATTVQLPYWHNTQTLLQRTVAVTGKNPRANATLGTTFANDGKWAEAEHYLRQAITEKPDFAEAHADLAGVYARQGKMAEAEENYQVALRLKEAQPLAHFGFANLLMKKGLLEDAKAHLTAVTRLAPDFAPAHYLLSVLLTKQHDPSAAIEQLQQAVHAKPDWFPALNSLAWNLSTQTEAKLRNGTEALTLALRAAHLKSMNDAGVMDTLAAAYAENSRFHDAIETAGTALQLARAANQNNLIDNIETHLKSYQSQQPWRE